MWGETGAFVSTINAVVLNRKYFAIDTIFGNFHERDITLYPHVYKEA